MFDHRLREKAKIFPSSEAFDNYKFHKKYLSPIKKLAMVLYYGVIPYLNPPVWCLFYYA